MPDVDLTPAFLEHAVQAREKAPDIRLIGFELRCRVGGEQEELQMIPLGIRLPYAHPVTGGWELPCTLHTSRGDVAVPIRLPF